LERITSEKLKVESKGKNSGGNGLFATFYVLPRDGKSPHPAAKKTLSNCLLKRDGPKSYPCENFLMNLPDFLAFD